MTNFADRRFIVIAGKGGVGRTTVAASMALAISKTGKNVLLAQTRAKDPVDRHLGGPPVGAEVTQIGPNLWAVNIDPLKALLEYGVIVLRFEAVARAVLENRIVSAFLHAVPGFDEYSLLGKAWYHTTEHLDGRPRFDSVIFDGPATGHLVQMLQVPQVIMRAAPSGPLSRDAKHMRRLFTDPARTVVHLVTLAEEMPVSETIDLQRLVREDLGMPLGMLVVNAIYPLHFPAESPAAEALGDLIEQSPTGPVGEVVSRARSSQMRRAMQDRYIAELAEAVPLPTVQLPMHFVPTLGRGEISTIADQLAEPLGISV